MGHNSALCFATFRQMRAKEVLARTSERRASSVAGNSGSTLPLVRQRTPEANTIREAGVPVLKTIRQRLTGKRTIRLTQMVAWRAQKKKNGVRPQGIAKVETSWKEEGEVQSPILWNYSCWYSCWLKPLSAPGPSAVQCHSVLSGQAGAGDKWWRTPECVRKEANTTIPRTP